MCKEGLALIEHLNETSEECRDSADNPACDPCTKQYEFFFERYDVFVLEDLLSIIHKTSQETLQKIEHY